MPTISYKQLLNSSDNLKALVASQNDGGATNALFNGSEPFDVLAAKAIFNSSAGAIGTIQDALNSISSTQGSIIYRNGTQWVGLLPGGAGQFLATGGPGANPTWGTGTGVLPDQTGSDGKFLTTDGVNASWSDTSVFPEQAGNAGRTLMTDGAAVSWQLPWASFPQTIPPGSAIQPGYNALLVGTVTNPGDLTIPSGSVLVIL